MSDGTQGRSAVPGRPGVVDRPPRADALLLTVGLVAVSTPGPLMAAIAAPALAVALCRNVLAVGSSPRSRWPPAAESGAR